MPILGPDGSPLRPQPARLPDLEAVKPPVVAPEAGLELGAFHWHRQPEAWYYHSDSFWGRSSNASWQWLQSQKGRWWMQTTVARTGGSPAEESPAFTWHRGLWWWKDGSGSWFLVHDGVPWVYGYLSRWGQEGLLQPESGTQMLYSADGSRVALSSPGRGTTVFDAASGKELERLGPGHAARQLPIQPARGLPPAPAAGGAFYTP